MGGVYIVSKQAVGSEQVVQPSAAWPRSRCSTRPWRPLPCCAACSFRSCCCWAKKDCASKLDRLSQPGCCGCGCCSSIGLIEPSDQARLAVQGHVRLQCSTGSPRGSPCRKVSAWCESNYCLVMSRTAGAQTAERAPLRTRAQQGHSKARRALRERRAVRIPIRHHFAPQSASSSMGRWRCMTP